MITEAKHAHEKVISNIFSQNNLSISRSQTICVIKTLCSAAFSLSKKGTLTAVQLFSVYELFEHPFYI